MYQEKINKTLIYIFHQWIKSFSKAYSFSLHHTDLALHLDKQAAIHAASQQAQDRSPHGGSGKQGGARMAQPERHTQPADPAVAGRARRSHAEQ